MLLILRAPGERRLGLFGGPCQWPDRVTATRMRPPLPEIPSAVIGAEVYLELDRVLLLLRQKITDSGLKQREVQERLGWGSRQQQ